MTQTDPNHNKTGSVTCCCISCDDCNNSDGSNDGCESIQRERRLAKEKDTLLLHLPVPAVEEARGATEGERIVSGLFPEEFDEFDRLTMGEDVQEAQTLRGCGLRWT